MPGGQGPVTFTWKARLADWASGTISLTVPLHCLFEPVDLHADALADLQPMRSSDSRTLATSCIRLGSKSVTSIWPGVTMSPTSTFLSMTVPSIGERMVAQSSVACTSLTVSWRRCRLRLGGPQTPSRPFRTPAG